MDAQHLIQLAQTATTLIATEALKSTAGETVKAIYASVKEKFHKPEQATALQTLVAAPDNFAAQSTVNERLLEVLQSNPEFAKELQSLLEKAGHNESSGQTNNFNGEIGKVIIAQEISGDIQM